VWRYVVLLLYSKDRPVNHSHHVIFCVCAREEVERLEEEGEKREIDSYIDT
jgi:hypothetical protein